jgi:hypothetical protein
MKTIIIYNPKRNDQWQKIELHPGLKRLALSAPGGTAQAQSGHNALLAQH